MPGQANMSTNATIDHCKTPNPLTYEILSWVMVVQFILGLPLNLSVLYTFIFRYAHTQHIEQGIETEKCLCEVKLLNSTTHQLV